MVGEVRGHGLMLCIDMVADKTTRAPLPKSNDFPQRVARRAYELGLMVRISGNNLILSPPLVITLDEVNALCSRLEQAFAEVMC
jgi:adenosylmethionine-8-amino-7-oxononanoate aminotransferase